MRLLPIYYYLKDDDNGDTQLITLYLILCSDNIDLRFLYFCCSSNYGIFYNNYQCVIHSFNDRFIINHYAITLQNSKYNGFLKIRSVKI